MSFYLRKHFKVGPVRLNLSKGGLGVSGGVTGARIGLSPRGAYVHGGRHGLYYRKYAKQGRGGRGAAVTGDIYLCSNRILIVDRSSRSYGLNRLLDVTLSVEDHTVQLTLDDRKSPLIFTMEDVASFAGMLQRHLSKL